MPRKGGLNLMDLGQSATTGERYLIASCERCLQAGDLSNMLKDAQFGVGAFPNSARLWQLLGLAYLHLGDVARARRVYADGLLHSPRDLTMLTFYACNLLCAGQVSMGLDILRRSFDQMSPANKTAVAEVCEQGFYLHMLDIEELPECLQTGLCGLLSDLPGVAAAEA